MQREGARSRHAAWQACRARSLSSSKRELEAGQRLLRRKLEGFFELQGHREVLVLEQRTRGIGRLTCANGRLLRHALRGAVLLSFEELRGARRKSRWQEVTRLLARARFR